MSSILCEANCHIRYVVWGKFAYLYDFWQKSCCTANISSPIHIFTVFWTIWPYRIYRGLYKSTLSLNEHFSHKCQCIRSVVPQLETTSTSQSGRPPMYLPWDYIDPSIWLTANVPYGQWSGKTLVLERQPCTD